MHQTFEEQEAHYIDVIVLRNLPSDIFAMTTCYMNKTSLQHLNLSSGMIPSGLAFFWEQQLVKDHVLHFFKMNF